MAPDTAEKIRYYSSAPAYGELPNWLHRSVMKEVVKRRFADADVSPIVVASLIRPLAIEELGLLDRTRDGTVRAAQTVDKVRTIGVPRAFVIFVLFIIVMTTTPQLLNSVIEEKMSRISEVMLGSVAPVRADDRRAARPRRCRPVLALVYMSGANASARGLLVVIALRACSRGLLRVPRGAPSTGRCTSRSARRAAS